MSRRGGKLARKAARVVESEREQDARAALLGKVRAEKDTALWVANRDFDKALAAAQEVRAEARKSAWDTYQEKRDTILKAFGKDGLEVEAA